MAQMWHSGNIINTAIQSYHKSVDEERKGHPYVSSGEPIISIVFSQMFLEAFINEIIEGLPVFSDPDKFERLIYLRKIKEKINRMGGLKNKYQLVKFAFNNQYYDEGTPLFKDFILLITLRNHLVHLEPTKAEITKWYDPGFTDQLQAKNILYKPEKRTILDFYHKLGTSRVARWACQTAIDVSKSLIESFPECSEKKLFNDRIKDHEAFLNKE